MYLLLWPGPDPGHLSFLGWPHKQINEKNSASIWTATGTEKPQRDREGKKRRISYSRPWCPWRESLAFLPVFLVHWHLYWYLGNGILIPVAPTYICLCIYMRGCFVSLFGVFFIFGWLIFCPALFLPGFLPFLKGTRLPPVSEPQPTGQNFYTPSLNENFSQVSSSQMEENT